jgi:hypothetical protein
MVFSLQLLSADATILKKNAHENIKKLPSKVASFRPNLAKTSPSLILYSVEMAHYGTYI